MKLSSIKLSGFKSFVDPTSVSFPSNMTSIVGPNGCGKSNVIDAVRWVLGESSAKNLRSDSMNDVVFNGSSSRKALSRASVELLFDNADGRIGGEYSDYSQISVKRTVELDGQSNYYLNGTNCRKKDITDVFLGTGLGPRSYAIIEQGMISQLVSAKPEEMRGHIEEVAGISKYLERKKETESRIKKTKENLSRLDDLRDEISRLLLKLNQQAKAAEKYSEYRKQEKHTQALLLVSKWKEIFEDLNQKQEKVKAQELRVEEANTSKTSSDSEILNLRTKQVELQNDFEKVQQEFYSLGAEISRHEQDIQLKRDSLRSFKDQLSFNKDNISVKEEELELLIEESNNAKIDLKTIKDELNSLKKDSIGSPARSPELEILEREWVTFINNSEIIIQDLLNGTEQISSLIKQGKLNSKQLEDLLNKFSSINSDVRKMKDEPSRLAKVLENFITGRDASSKDEKINILHKTESFAEIQANIATISNQSNHIKDAIISLEQNNEDLENQMSELTNPIVEIEKELEKLLSERLILEKRLQELRKLMDKNSEDIQQKEREKIEKEQEAVLLRESLETLRLDKQASKIETENIESQIKDSGKDLKDLLDELLDGQDSKHFTEEIALIERRISRLGAINLAAKEEFDQESKRKEQLDSQHEELAEALITLEKAIQKIDKETRTTFKDTFDKLNQSIAKSFPKLFGGGHAELILLGDDLLTSGVGITARPPGKRNSSVSQLSGGEKALTAIATVFAFFELNPAPFCLLDEVDAPLDDLNTMRYIDLVKEMSEKIQFVYITHNKISMEQSKHLMGVTMQEPGVSRLVAVDVDQAIKLAAS